MGDFTCPKITGRWFGMGFLWLFDQISELGNWLISPNTVGNAMGQWD